MGGPTSVLLEGLGLRGDRTYCQDRRLGTGSAPRSRRTRQEFYCGPTRESCRTLPVSFITVTLTEQGSLGRYLNFLLPSLQRRYYFPEFSLDVSFVDPLSGLQVNVRQVNTFPSSFGVNKIVKYTKDVSRRDMVRFFIL